MSPFPDEAVLAELARIPEPAILFLSGGCVGAVNRAAACLLGPVVGVRGEDLVEQRTVHKGDLPYARALRGEVVGQGERIAMTFADGSTYQALVTSTPVVRNGTVVAALSVWHDFGAYAQRLAGREREA